MSGSLPDPKRWWALFLLCAAQFIVILDTSIIGVALPFIQRALGISPTNLQWVFNAYVIAFGGLLLLGGRFADLFGQRRLFMLGFAVLATAALLTGLARSSGALFAGRAAMGVGAALIAPAALSLVVGLFAADPSELGKALGFWGASAAAGGTGGVFLGGVITQWLDWRWTFLVNVPLGLLVLGLAPLVLRPGAARRGSIDVAGSLTVTASLVLAVYAIVTANTVGWASLRTIGLLGLAVILFVTFVGIQAIRREPLVPLAIFKTPNLAAGNAVMALLGGAWIPLWFFLNLYLQQVLGYGAFASGSALLPITVTIMVLMVGATARIVGRFGFKPTLVVGLLLLGGSLLLFARAPVGGSFLADVLPASLIAAVGMSLSYVPALIAGTSGARQEEAGLASGLINTTYQIGSALGLAAMTAVAIASATGRLDAGATHRHATNAGFHAAFIGAAGIAVAGAAVAAVGLRRPRQIANDPSPATARRELVGQGD